MVEVDNKMDEVFDRQSGEYIESPSEMKAFMCEIQKVCKKYGFSISHEDEHGAFIIQEYKDSNIQWLKQAFKDYK
jgi:hypothetical protein